MPIGRLFYEIGGDTSGLDKSLKAALDNVSKFDVSVKAAGQRFIASFQDMINPTAKMVDQLKLLQMAGYSNQTIWKAMGDQFQAAAAQAKKFSQDVDPAIKKMIEFGKGTEAGKFGVESLGKSMIDFARNPLATAQAGLVGMLEKMGPLAVGLGGVAAAAIAGGSAIFSFMKSATDEFEQFENMAAITGMAVDDLMALQQVAKEAGLAGMDLGRVISKLNSELGKPEAQDFEKGLTALGISLKNLNGTQKDAVTLLDEFFSVLKRIPDAQEAAQVGAAVLGSRQRELIALGLRLNGTLKENIELTKQKVSYDEETKASLREYDRQLDLIDQKWVSIKRATVGATAAVIEYVSFWSKPMAALEAFGKPKEIGISAGATDKGGPLIPEGVTLAKLQQYDLMTKANKELAEAQKKAADELVRFADETIKALSPADELAKRMAKMADVSGKSGQILMQYGEQLKSAAAKQLTLTGTLDGLTIDLIEAYDTMVSMAKGTGDASAAMDELDRIIRKVISEDLSGYLSGATDAFQKLNAELGKMKPIELFPKNAEGKTPAEQIKDVSGAVNQTIPEVLTSWEKGGDSMAETWRRQVSTIVTDWSRGIADIIMSGQSFGQKLKAMFTDTAKGILRMFIEQLFKPLQNWLSKIMDGLFGMSSSSGGGGGGILNSLFSGLLKGIGSGGGGGAISTIGQAGAMGAGSVGIPLANAGMLGGIGLAGTMGTIPMFTGGISAATASAMGAGAYGIPLAGAGTGSLAGAGGAAAAGGGGLGGIFGGMGSAFMGIAAAIPVAGWIAIGVAVTAAIIAKVMHKDAWEAGAKEAARDLGGINIGEKAIKTFFTSVGLTEKQAFPIRKDLLTSPLFISQIAVPAAQAQGKLESFLKSLEKVTVDTKIAASGYLNFRAEVEQGIDTGNWDAFNKAWEAAFKKSEALTAVMPDLTSLLAAAGEAAADVAVAVDSASEGFQSLKDAIVASLPAAKDMFEVFWDTGEILPELSDLIAKYGGNLATFQKAANFGQLRADLAGINELMGGLADILPELSPIQQILQGQAWGPGTWGDLQAMGLDPSKLVKMTDLVAFESKWGEGRSQFEQTGKLTKGGVLEQSLWQFGGGAGMTALENYGKGFNTITPALLDSVKTGMDAAFKAERAGVMDYLRGVSDTMTSEIETASRDIVAELELILQAIKAQGTVSPATVAAAGNTVTTGGQGSQTIIINGDVYGYDEFRNRVAQAVKSEYYRGGMAYLPA